MLKKISPQKVSNDAKGYIVQVNDRYHIQYQEVKNSRKVIIDVDFGVTVGIYCNKLLEWITEDGKKFITDKEKQVVLERVDEGLKLMGCKTKLILL